MDYYDQMLIASSDSAKELLKTYSVHPPDNADGREGKKYDEEDVRATKLPVILADMKNRKVARLHLTKGARGQKDIIGRTEGGDSLFGEASYDRSAQGVPVYWLPWNTAGAVISLEIPTKGTRSAGRLDPDRFFTAAINGCSIFFAGTPANPTIFHCGGDTEVSGPSASAKFWRDLMGSGKIGTTVLGEVNKEHYITTQGVKSGPLNTTTTQAAKDYEVWLKTNSSKQLEIEQVAPWGCVMGMRDDAGNWKFYLQQNAAITYYTLKKKGLFSDKMVRKQEKLKTFEKDSGGVDQIITKKDQDGDTVMIDRKRVVSRPISFRQVWPNGKAGVRIDLPIPRSKHG